MNKYTNGSTKTIGSVIKAIEIIEVLAESNIDLGVTEISNRLNYGVSATYHLLNTLKLCNIVEQDMNTKKYRLGLKLLEISTKAKRENYLANISKPFLEKLREETEETSNLIVLDGNEVVYIQQAESTKMIKMFTKIGARVPAYCTGAGKVLLADLPKKKQATLIEKIQFVKYTENTIVDPQQLVYECQIAKKRGYAFDNGEKEEGVVCVAAPVYDFSGRVIAAISVSGPSFRLNGHRLETIIESLISIAYDLSNCLGFSIKSTDYDE